ncbi:MAG TPA: DNA repair protein RadC [Candidatus Paceibacterota bacterium]|nr:DNA repair protein RadC [Candidatus Paceibacterota bacterium]
MNTYTLKSTPLIITNSKITEKPYVLTFRDLPKEDKPREKMLALGAKSLASAELLALVLNVGTKKEDVLAMSERVLKEYGERSLADNINPTKLSDDLGIPLIKAIQIAACAELGRRFFDKRSGRGATIRTGKDVYEYTKDMRELPKEHLRGIYLNAQYKVIHDEIISIGTIDANLVHAREVFRPAIEHSAAAVILVHNHPSNNTTPSFADQEITLEIKKAGDIIGIALLDHVIVTKSGYKSVI